MAYFNTGLCYIHIFYSFFLSKMQNELENQQQKYLLKLEETKKLLREEANIEMEIERQKYKEMLKNFQNKNEALEGKVSCSIYMIQLL